MKYKILALLLVPGLLFAEAANDQEVYDHLYRRAQVAFTSLTKRYGCSDGADWKVVIGKVFTRVMRASGRSDNIAVCVVKRPGFNAGALLSGQFIIHEDALATLSAVAKSVAGDDAAREVMVREILLAGIVGHELAHFYNQHSFRSYKKMHSLKPGGSDEEILFTSRSFSREHEFDADRTGYMLLQAAGYDADQSMVNAFTVMKALEDKQKQSGGDGQHYYLSTHPSTRERLAQFNSQKKDWYRETAALEKAFADVNAGINLSNATATLVKALEKYKDNQFLQQVLAVARHKRWLDSVPLSEQKFRAILDVPSFNDQMIAPQRGTKRVKGIPGDKALYYAAKQDYEKIVSGVVPYTVRSNFAVLLAYSDDAKDRERAEKMASVAATEQVTAQTANNLAITWHMAGKATQAKALLSEVSMKVEKTLKNARKENLASAFRFMGESQLVDHSYVLPNLTIILNYSLALEYAGEIPQAKSVAMQYLEQYDNNSVWARHLAATHNLSAKLQQKTERKYVMVAGIRIGSTVGELAEKWKSQRKIGTDAELSEIWSYPDISTQVRVEGTVNAIALTGTNSPKFNGVGVGSTRVELEKVLGEPQSLRNGYYRYAGKQPAAVLYQNGIVSEILLLAD